MAKMIFCIEETPLVYTFASANRVERFAQQVTGKQYNIRSLKRWTDSERAAIGVFRVRRSPPPTVLQFERAEVVSSTDYTRVGDAVEPIWTVLEDPIGAAQDEALRVLRQKHKEVLRQGVKAEGHVFASAGSALENYQSLGAFMGAGGAYPTDPVPFPAVRISDGKRKRKALNAAQFLGMLGAISLLRLGSAKRADRLEGLIEGAADLAALRVEYAKIQTGWPLAPPIPPETDD